MAWILKEAQLMFSKPLTLLIEKVFKSLLPFEADLLYTEIGLLNNYAHLKYCNT